MIQDFDPGAPENVAFLGLIGDYKCTCKETPLVSPISTTSTVGIYVSSKSGIRCIANTSTTLPDGKNGVKYLMGGTSSPSIDDNYNVAFFACAAGSSMSGLYIQKANESSGLTKVATTTDLAPGTSIPFHNFFNPSVDTNSGRTSIAFTANYKKKNAEGRAYTPGIPNPNPNPNPDASFFKAALTRPESTWLRRWKMASTALCVWQTPLTSMVSVTPSIR